MVTVLLSIRPKWCRLILTKEKIVEIRKNAPKLGNTHAFRVLLYETKAGRGAVVGEAICFAIVKQEKADNGLAELSCLRLDQITEYAHGKPVFGWYLGKVIEYQQPHPLSEYGLERPPQSWCYLNREVA